MRPLDDFLPEYEFSERHRVAIAASPDAIDRALRSVALRDIPVARALWFVRRLGRLYGDATKPFVGGELPGTVLEDVPGEGIVIGLTGQFWRLRGGDGGPRPRSVGEFLAYDRPEACKAVIDFRVGPSLLTTETRVHVPDPVARRKFRRYWLVIRPFSGLIRILFLRAARKRAEGKRTIEEVGMSSDQSKLEVLERMGDAFNEHDLDVIMSLFVDDCVFESPRGPDPWGRRYVGKDAVREGLGARFSGIPDVHYDYASHFVAGDRGASEWTLTGTTVDSERLEVRGCDLWTFDGDRIVRKDAFWKIVES